MVGDSEQVLERLHRRYYPSFLRFFARKGCALDTCEDLTQEIFVRLCRSLATFEERSKLQTWLYTIANHVWLNKIRDGSTGKHKGQELPLGDESAHEAGGVVLESTDRGPADHLLARERVDRLRRELEKLPPRMRRCAQLRFVQELKYREIAALEQVTIDTVKSQLAQARKRLGLALEAYFNAAGSDESNEVPE